VSLEMLQQSRFLFLKRVLVFLFSLLFLRCFQLQVLRGSVYKKWSEKNHVRQIPIVAPRGFIFDRTGEILVKNRPSYSLFVVPYEFRKNPADQEIISSLLGISIDEIETCIDKAGGGPFTPVRLIQNMDFATLSVVEENRADLPGIFYQIEPVRMYSTSVKASHVIGYCGEINFTELSSLKARGYHQGDIIGKNGVERSYNNILRGERGYRYVEVDVRGREVGNFGGKRDIPPIPGSDIMLTLNVRLQGFVENLLDGKRGAAVVMDSRSGDILAMVSKPDYNLEPFARRLPSAVWKRLQTDPDKPLLNRAIQAQLPPGSTYKLVLTTAALQQHVIDPEEKVFCNGYFMLGRKLFRCWKPQGHGYVNLLDAIEVSCNVFFYQLGLKTGIDPLVKYGKLFGFGSLTRVDLVGESKGLLPDREYLNKKYGKRKWGKGMIVNLSVGQGDILVTPIQMAKLVSIIAMDGKFTVPHVLLAIKDQSSDMWKKKTFRSKQIEGLSPEIFQILKEGMYRVVNYPNGTGRAAHVPDIEVCGKTGTAQNPQGKPHAWFVGFAPREMPRIVVVVVIENGGTGGGIAAPIAGMIFRYFFQMGRIS